MRFIRLGGARNFRDFGGYATSDGRNVRSGALYRSGHLGSLSEDDKKTVAGLGIRLICDLRTGPERSQNPSPLSVRQGSTVLELPVNPGDFHQFVEAIKKGGDTERLARDIRELSLSVNRELVTAYADTYKAMFAALLEHDDPVLVHCTGGRDRTGIAVALILLALGVSEELILDDYLLSNEGTSVDQLAAWFREYANVELDPYVLAPMARVERDFLRAALDEMKSTYESLDNYLATQLGLTSAALSDLRRRFLT